jgi:hypothetical protein
MNLSHIWDAIKHLFVSTSQAIIEFLQPFALAIEQGGEEILITAAKNAVQVGFAAPGDGSAKMAAALAAFTEEVTAKGLPFLENQARALIEVALQNAKASAAPSPAPNAA